ncbi:hypothetical protein Tco_1530662 [Tanacetum coccineum]
MRPHRLLILLSDSIVRFDITLGKASVVAEALSRNDRANTLKVRALVMTINLNLLPRIHEARVEDPKKENVKDENIHGMDKEFENRLDRTLYIRRRSWLPCIRDNFMLEVSPCKGEIRFSKRGKLNPRYIGPFKILAKVGTVACHLELQEKLSRVHSTFHALKLKKCLVDEPLAIPLDEIQVDDKLNFIEEPVEVMDREVNRLKQSRIPIVKVRWNSKMGPEFT